MRSLRIVVGYALREALRRRVFVVVLVLTALFLALYALGADRAFDETSGLADTARQAGVDAHTVAGATVFGLSMFATLFLGVILAVFLTLGAVRGDAERGLLQPIVVRPLGRSTFLLARYLGSATTAALYAAAVYAAAAVITGATGGWWPDQIVRPALMLAAAVAIVTAISLLGSVFLSATANGIMVFMVFGAGLTTGLLGQVGEAIGSDALVSAAHGAAWAFPFEALYENGLAAITADTVGFTRLAIDLGPFGGAREAGPWLWPWAFAYTGLVGAFALWGFSRKDL